MEQLESIFQRVLLSSLQMTPDAMLEECLGICMDLSGATGGSILGEEGARIEFLFSNVESLIGVDVPWDSIAGTTLRTGHVIYTFAPADRRHFGGVDERIEHSTKYLFSIPIPSVHAPN